MRAALFLLLAACSAGPPHSAAGYVPAPYVTRGLAEAERGLLFHGGRDAHIQPSMDKTLSLAWIYTQDRQIPPVIEFKPEAMAEAERYGHEAVVWIMGHELGHQILVDEGLKSKGKTTELAADTWGGCALAELHLDPGPALKYIAAAMEESSTHPGPEFRAEALLTGYERCMWDGP